MAYGFKYNKTPGRSPGFLTYTKQDIKHVCWCHKKNIKIAVIPNGAEWNIEISLNGKIHLDPEKYTGYDALGKMYEYYKYYYDKYRN